MRSTARQPHRRVPSGACPIACSIIGAPRDKVQFPLPGAPRHTVREFQLTPGTQSKFKCFLASFKSVWGSKKIKELEARIGRYRESINDVVFPLFRYILSFSFLYQHRHSTFSPALKARWENVSTRGWLCSETNSPVCYTEAPLLMTRPG